MTLHGRQLKHSEIVTVVYQVPCYKMNLKTVHLMWYLGTSDSVIKQVIRVISNTSVLKKKTPIGEMNDKIAIFLKKGKFHVSQKIFWRWTVGIHVQCECT